MTKDFKENLLFFLILVVYLLGALVELVDVDSAQYAAIAMEMVQTDTYLQIYEAGADYLDKPPLIFWLGALFYKVFGIHGFVFKIPTLICSAVALFYTFKTGCYLFNKTIGLFSALILSTSIGYIWINSDVKTDALVTNLILIAVFHLIRFIDYNKLKDLVFGGIIVSLAMMSKGPMGLIFPGLFTLIYIVNTKNWKAFLRPHWLLFPVIIIVFLFPMLYGLNEQFDLHPEKLINGEKNTSGIKFFLWDQSFGRIAGTNIYKNDLSFFYLFHCLLLLMLPYSLVLFKSIWDWINGFKFFNNQVSFLFISTIIMMVALSFSSYKIPHYSSVAFPYCAIILTNTMVNFENKKDQRLLKYYCLLLIVIGVALCFFLFFCFTPNLLSIVLVFLSFSLLLLFFIEKKYSYCLASIGVFSGILFFSHLLPSMQNYTIGKRFKNLIEENHLSDKKINFVNRDSRALEFYLKKRSKRLSWQEVLDNSDKESSLFYMEESAIQAFVNDGLLVKNYYCLDVYDINRINIRFLIPYSRNEELEQHCLVEFKN